MDALPEAELGARDRRSCNVSAHEAPNQHAVVRSWNYFRPSDVLIRTLLRASEACTGSVRQEASRKIQGSDVLTDGQATPACSWR